MDSLTPAKLQEIQSALKTNEVVILKFSAVWCGPCKVIKPLCEEWKKNIMSTDRIYWIDIDIDESIELYAAFKSKRMINGVPTLFAFRGDKKREQWYIPDDSVSGGNIKAVADFLQRCLL
jgi:thioredoxin 1